LLTRFAIKKEAHFLIVRFFDICVDF